jgi:hypothetical protein
MDQPFKFDNKEDFHRFFGVPPAAMACKRSFARRVSTVDEIDAALAAARAQFGGCLNRGASPQSLRWK